MLAVAVDLSGASHKDLDILAIAAAFHDIGIWLDVCLMALSSRVPRTRRRALVSTFPRRGFHRFLIRQTAAWWWRHPFRPLPMFKL